MLINQLLRKLAALVCHHNKNLMGPRDYTHSRIQWQCGTLAPQYTPAIEQWSKWGKHWWPHYKLLHAFCHENYARPSILPAGDAFIHYCRREWSGNVLETKIITWISWIIKLRVYMYITLVCSAWLTCIPYFLIIRRISLISAYLLLSAYYFAVLFTRY